MSDGSDADAPAAEGADADGGTDHKSALNQYCHKYCSRPVTKSDVVYTKSKFGARQFQAIVKLNCMGGQEYAGEVCDTSKEAEKSAAYQALESYKTVPLPAPPPARRKNKGCGLHGRAVDPVTGEPMEGDELDDASNPALTDKVRLNAIYMKLLKRALLKGETVYECTPLLRYDGQVDGFIATVALTSLPGEWGDRAFRGELCPNKQEATQSAAKVALAEILADPEMGKLAAQSLSGKGHGKSKGWHWTRGWDNEFRERVGEGPVSGEVLEWKGHFGWIMPSQEPDHPAASRRGGKVYVHRRDLSADAPADLDLPVGAKVQFLVYCDPSGLGAEQVALT